MSIRTYIISGIIVILACTVVGTTNAHATTSLRVTPLHYNASLKAGERQQGVVDITNPGDTAVTVEVSTKSFRQTNAQGDVTYYDDAQVSAGIIPDMQFSLGPGETERMAFLLDGTKLPTGNVFGALMFATKPPANKSAVSTSTSIRLAVLFAITNGTAGDQQAEITAASIPFWQIGYTIHGIYTIKNTGDPSKSSGFFPQVAITAKPFSSTVTHDSSLVFAGISRDNQFAVPTNRFGFYKVTVSYGSSSRSSWVFIASPFALIVAGVAGLLFVSLATIWWKRARHLRKSTP